MTTSRATRSKEDVLRTFRTAEILDATRRVLGAQGIAETSMERIALEAGVAKGTLYLYFENREHLVACALERAHDEVLTRARAESLRARGYANKLRAVVRAVLVYSMEHQAFCRSLLERPDPASTSEVVAQRLAENSAEYRRLVSGLLSRGARAGEFRRVDATRAARYLLDLVRGTLEQRLSRGRRSGIDADVDAIVDFFLRGVGERGVARREER